MGDIAEVFMFSATIWIWLAILKMMIEGGLWILDRYLLRKFKQTWSDDD